VSGELQRTVVIPFAPSSGQHQLEIRPDFGFYSDDLVHLLLIPDVGATLTTDVGEARLGNAKILDVAGGVLSFSGGDSAALPLPVDGVPPQFRTLFAFDSKGQGTSAAAHYDPQAFEVRLSRPCTAAVAYTQYKARVRTLTYRPLVQASPAGGAKTTYGVIAAYYQGALVVYPVTPPSLDQGVAVIELYRRVSPKVINADGQFEKPPDYPQVGSYPGKSFVLDVVGSREIERVHEIGFIDTAGHTFVYSPSVDILEPYVGDAYSPTISTKIATLDPEKYPRDLIARARDFIKSKGLGQGL